MSLLRDILLELTPGELAARIDHAVLAPDAGRRELEDAIDKLENLGLRCLILTPTLLREARGSTRKCLGAVVGFPYGYGTIESKVKELEDVIGYGAVEADIVANTQALLLGNREYYVNELKALTEICREVGIKCKVIIETPLLSDPSLISSTVELIATNTSPDYIKTSTGFSKRPTYPDDILAIKNKLRELGSSIGVKAAGGIRTGLQALIALSAGADIIGTSRPQEVIDSYKQLRQYLSRNKG